MDRNVNVILALLFGYLISGVTNYEGNKYVSFLSGRLMVARTLSLCRDFSSLMLLTGRYLQNYRSRTDYIPLGQDISTRILWSRFYPLFDCIFGT